MRLSAEFFRRAEQRLLNDRGKKTTTQKTYRSAYLEFMRFNLALDRMPELLDDQLAMFVAYKTVKGDYSSTVSSYLAGIKSYLAVDGIEINTRTARLRALIRACKYKNDRVIQRMAIKESLLVRIIRQVDLIFHKYIKFDSSDSRSVLYNRHFCPFEIVEEFAQMRGEKLDDRDLFFKFRDGSPVKPHQLSGVLKRALRNIGIDPSDFGTHSLRIGFATQLVSLSEIRRRGCWKSNIIYRYIRMIK